jgi:drug/metabolite transporter (DMT)-like permease
MPAPLLIVAATFLFATMLVCVKLASQQYSPGEIVFYRSLFSVVYLVGWARINQGTLATTQLRAHFWRSLSGVVALMLWFVAIVKLPLATATTMTYMSSVWLAVSAVATALVLNRGRNLNWPQVAAVVVGFIGVVLVMRPTIAQDQLWHGLAGLASGVLAAVAYAQVKTLTQLGEPEYRTVFYFSVGGVLAGAAVMAFTGMSSHTLDGVLLLLAIGMLATVGQMMLTLAYSRGSTLTIAALQYTGILFSFLYGLAIFNDELTASGVAGILLIVMAGLAVTTLNVRANSRLKRA